MTILVVSEGAPALRLALRNAVRASRHHLYRVATHCEQTLKDLAMAVLSLPSTLVESAHKSVAI